jgi:hypothetical protein
MRWDFGKEAKDGVKQILTWPHTKSHDPDTIFNLIGLSDKENVMRIFLLGYLCEYARRILIYYPLVL